MGDLYDRTVTELATLQPPPTSTQLVEDCLGRIRERDAMIGAFTYVAGDDAIADARARDKESARGERRGPLHGIPVAIKDIFDTRGMPTAYGSPIWTGHMPLCDASCVSLLRAAGAVIIGKTVTAEFAFSAPGPTRNPHNLEHTPGGSSQGSAASVADFMVPLSLGTQTAGSVIRPAAYCGVVGYKPTYNWIERSGVKFASQSLDTIGIMGRSVPDVALAAGVLVGRHVTPLLPLTTPPRIGLCRTHVWARAGRSYEGPSGGRGRPIGPSRSTRPRCRAPARVRGSHTCPGAHRHLRGGPVPGRGTQRFSRSDQRRPPGPPHGGCLDAQRGVRRCTEPSGPVRDVGGRGLGRSGHPHYPPGHGGGPKGTRIDGRSLLQRDLDHGANAVRDPPPVHGSNGATDRSSGGWAEAPRPGNARSRRVAASDADVIRRPCDFIPRS